MLYYFNFFLIFFLFHEISKKNVQNRALVQAAAACFTYSFWVLIFSIVFIRFNFLCNYRILLLKAYFGVLFPTDFSTSLVSFTLVLYLYFFQ